MNIQTIFVLLLASLTFSKSQQQIEKSQEITAIVTSEISNDFTINDKDYTLNFSLKKVSDQKATLIIAIKLHNAAYYISPFSKRESKGKFYMDFGSYTNLNFEDDIIETPRSIEDFANGYVNWVRVNTTYKQTLNILSKDDFEVFGRVKFTIEPRCTLEEIPFGISYQDGVLKIIKNPKC